MTEQVARAVCEQWLGVQYESKTGRPVYGADENPRAGEDAHAIWASRTMTLQRSSASQAGNDAQVLHVQSWRRVYRGERAGSAIAIQTGDEQGQM